ncbi:MAG: hypothetical protein K2N95_18530 [Lachnospiraceae bacterium]|nr:hypothetical protein [Lachnospiraceae bacterium]
MANSVKQYQISFDADELAEKIEAAFSRYRVRISITKWVNRSDRVIYNVKLKGDTRESQFFARLSDVQLKLRLPFFQAFIQDFHIYLAVADQEMEYPHLPDILFKSRLGEKCKSMQLPYVVGYGTVGNLMIVDLGKFPHLLIGGASNSGKSVGLQALLVSIMVIKSFRDVNFILVDVGATNLIPFDGLPHLSCRVIRDRDMACGVLISLKNEMERRIGLQTKASDQFKNLPRLVLAIDEFPALFTEMADRQMIKIMVNAVSSLLQRGRHAKIHVVIAAQNPTYQNMRVDLGNITSRIAFRCAKKNFSETILDDSGAENLSGNGDMLFKCPQFSEVKRLQGVFISPEELPKMIALIRILNKDTYYTDEMIYRINVDELQQFKEGLMEDSVCHSSMKKKNSTRDKMFAEVVLWTLGHDEISCNMLIKNFNLGWNRASQFIEKLYDLGIVGDLDAKLPRKVLSQAVDDVSEDVLKLLMDNGVSEEAVLDAIRSRN